MRFETYLRLLGNNIKAARVKRGIRQIEVHENCGLSYRHYQNIEAGKVNVTIGTLFRLAKLYGMTPDDLVRVEGRFES